MTFTDITNDTKKVYSLKANEKRIFFLHNRPGEIVFELAGEGAEAHVFALFSLSGDTKKESALTQIHRAPNTTSSFLGRSILFDNALIDWKGLIHIKPRAGESDARQEMRNLILSPTASAFSLPSLEIENNDVRCGHATTTSAPNAEQLFFLRSRGFSASQAENILIEGFTVSLFDAMKKHLLEKEVLALRSRILG